MPWDAHLRTGWFRWSDFTVLSTGFHPPAEPCTADERRRDHQACTLAVPVLMTRQGPSKQPFEVIDGKAQHWARTWRHGATQEDFIAALQSASQEATHVELPALSVSRIRSVTRGLSDKTGRGFDNIGPSDIRSLPTPAKSSASANGHGS